ncbi:hypothetical protein WMF27_03220 [Sorangium sp. So ce281]|uniref:hypothetical protein n=1 Tax=unclassified Sorangium TaxID=2621164 RepID=UPI003F5FD5EE
MHTPGRLLVIPAVLLTLAACANGTDDLLPGYYEEQAGGGGLGGDGGAGGEDLSVSSSSSSSVSVGSTGAGGAEGEGSDAGSNEGDGGASGGGGAVAECDYAAPNTCAGAEDLGEISGDDGGDSVTLTERGTTSKWFKVYVVDKFNVPGSEVFKATLTSPPGMNFDLIVYPGELEVDAPDCFTSGVRGQGTPESFTTTWNDRAGPDDHLWFAIEVRHVEGTACGSEATWTLTVKGY